MRDTWRALVVATICASLHTSCGDPISTALTDFDVCTHGPMLSIEHGEASVDVECKVKDGIHLVGIPGRQISVDELTAIGLSKTLAEMFAGAHNRAQWCHAVEFARDPNPPPDVTKIPIANIECVSTELQIDAPYQTRAPRVRLVITRSPAGMPTLTVFEPVD